MRQALEMALEALEKADKIRGFPNNKKAITAIKEALSQPERDYERGFIDGMQKQMQSSVDKAVNRMAQPEQEPVGYWMGKFSDGAATLYKVPQESFLGYTYQNIPLYAIPPQRKPLTDEEIQMCYETTGYCQTLRPQDKFAVFALARAIEAKVKEKNNG